MGFQGGQTSLWKRFPKLDDSSLNFRMPTLISLDKIQHLWEIGRIPDLLITPEILKSAGVKGIQHGIYVRGEGASRFKLKEIVFFATKFDSFAINKIESLEGHAVSIHLSENGWRRLGNHSKQLNVLRTGNNLPPDDWKELNFYLDYSARGYLSEEVRDKLPPKAKKYLQDNFIFPDKVNYQKILC